MTFGIQVKAALKNGELKPEEVRELLLMIAQYSGYPRAAALVGLVEEKIAEVQLEIEKAEREYDLNTAAELKYGTLPGLEEQLEQAKTKEEDEGVNSEEEGEKMLRDEVVPDDIASVSSCCEH